MTYPEWLEELRRLLRLVRPDIEPSSLDPNPCYAAWKGGLPPSTYAQSAMPLLPAAKGQFASPPGSLGFITRDMCSVQDQAQLERRFRQFHFGAFAIPWAWGPLHNKDILFWTLPICFLLPCFGWIASIGIGVWAGVNGYRWAWESGRFSSPHELDETESAWIYWGVAYFLITFAIVFAGFMLQSRASSWRANG